MDFVYNKHGETSLLVYQLKETERVDTVGMEMLRNNSLKNVLSLSLMQVNESKYLQYNVSSMISFETYFDKVVDYQCLLDSFLKICDAFDEGYEYMLEPRFFVMDKKYVFVHDKTGDIKLVYLPVLSNRDECDMKTFFKEILFTAHFNLQEDCNYVARLINFLNSDAPFSLEEFRKFLTNIRNVGDANNITRREGQEELSEETLEATASDRSMPGNNATMMHANDIVHAPVQHFKSVAHMQTPSQRDYCVTSQPSGRDASNPNRAYSKANYETAPLLKETVQEAQNGQMQFTRALNQTDRADYAGRRGIEAKQENHEKRNQRSLTLDGKIGAVGGNTSLLKLDAGQTSILSQAGVSGLSSSNSGTLIKTPLLYRKRNGETIKINKMLFRIGSGKVSVDYCVRDNRAVSHTHADIFTEKGQYFICDKNSLNHTFINGRMIDPGQKMILHDGDKITLANEEFVFRIK